MILSNYDAQQIRDATEKVFAINGYEALGLQDGALLFQREATRRETVDYAGFAGAHEGDKVVMQVRVRIEPKAGMANTYWLTCKAYAVANPDQQVFQTTTALFNFQSGPYQKMLDSVKNNLKVAAMKATEKP